MTAVYYKLPSDLPADIEMYERDVSQFMAGQLSAALLKSRRVPRGVYEQRQDGTFMLRVRVAGGTLNAAQTKELASLSREFGNGLLHVTTRQDVQFHDVTIKNTPVMMRRLMTVGLTSKGGGGNSVRNITACPYAGICRAERFDVTPCAHAVTEYLLPLVGSYNLPRKYKIAFSGCAADCALAQVADLGFIAEVRDGTPGFRVMAGGGLGGHSRIADTLLDWSPATDVIRVAETVRRLFDQLGDRSNKHRARLRYVFDRIGAEEFRRRFAERASEVVRDGVPEWVGSVSSPPDGPGAAPCPPRAEYREGVRVIPQKQANYVSVPLHLPVGFLPAADLARLGDLAAQYSRESGVRTTRSQNLILRFVKPKDLSALAASLRLLETDVLTPVPLDRFVTCAGAATCRMGICLARNAARACAGALAKAGITRDTLDAMEFYLNGCTNACGQHPIAPIGFFGAAHREHEHLLPSYGITLGGRCGVSGARLGTAVGRVPARALPAFVRDLAVDFESRRTDDESFHGYFDRLGPAHFQALAARHTTLPSFTEHPEFYRDVDAAEEFSLAGRGAGECGSGVFEVIQQDLMAAKKADNPLDILLATARALLVTRGIDARDSYAVLREFERHFIDTGLVAEEFRALLPRARGYAQGWKTAFEGQESAITRLRARVEWLYSTLDANLEFHPPDAPAPAVTVAGVTPVGSVTAELDLSGIPCPANFVKARLKLHR